MVRKARKRRHEPAPPQDVAPAVQDVAPAAPQDVPPAAPQDVPPVPAQVAPAPPQDGAPPPNVEPPLPAAIPFVAPVIAPPVQDQAGHVNSGHVLQVPVPGGMYEVLSPSPRTNSVHQPQDREVTPTLAQDGITTSLRSPSIWALGKSPINVEKLCEFLELYPDRDDALILNNGFKFGFKLGYVGSHKASSCNNLVSACIHSKEVGAKLKKEIELGRIAGPFANPPISNLKTSPIGVVPKQDGGWRLIVHLSYPLGSSVNDGFEPDSCSVQYTSFDKVADMIFSLGKNALMAKRDLKGAFRLLPVFPGDFHLLGMKFENMYYVDKCLPMGLSKSPLLFEKFSTLIHWLVTFQTNLGSMDHYLDDFIFAGEENTSQCTVLVSSFEKLCSELGIPIADEKSVEPTTVLTFLGLELDSTEMLIRIPCCKIQELLHMLEGCLHRKKLSLKELQVLVGKLCFFGQAVRSSRAFLRRFYDAMAGLKKPYYKIRLNQGLKEDISMWITFLQEFNGVVHIPAQAWLSSQVLELFTDSAGNPALGCGCYFSGKWAFFQWPGNWKNTSLFADITFLEMVPVVLAVMLWGEELHDKKIVFHIDNQALVHVINSQSSKSKQLMKLVRVFVLLAMKHSIIFKACHIASLDNSIADSISRKQFGRLLKLAPQAEKTPKEIPAAFQSLIYGMRLIDC